jgi:hypothetical protein
MIRDVLKARDVSKHCALCGRSFARFPFDEEHIFPKWLQHHHNLWTRKLNIPNFIGKRYDSVKLVICQRCNNKTYGSLETCLAPVFSGPDAFTAAAQLDDYDLAVWLGKIFWLLIRKSHSVVDFRTRDLPEQDRILPNDMLPGTLYLGMIQRAFATGKGMVSCYAGDPPIPEFFYGEPYSLYRFRIDPRDGRFEGFDFFDSPVTLGVGFRTSTLGIICLFDGGLHQRFRSPSWEFLTGQALHPVQFAEVAARMFYDSTVLDEDAMRVTYYWNKKLNAVISQCHTPRNYDPYLAEKHDAARLAAFIGHHTLNDPAQILQPDGRTVSCLRDENGGFLPFAVTDEDIQAARANPDRIVFGPMDANWRTKAGGSESEP